MNPILVRRVHEQHVRLGIRSGNCPVCLQAEPVHRPEWIRRLEDGQLRAKELSA